MEPNIVCAHAAHTRSPIGVVGYGDWTIHRLDLEQGITTMHIRSEGVASQSARSKDMDSIFHEKVSTRW